MSDQNRLSVLVLSSLVTQKRLDSCLENGLIEFCFFAHFREALDRLEKVQFNIALIEGFHEEARLACREIFSTHPIPIAVLVRSLDLNWHNYGSWPVDGFITEESTNLELVARVKAIARRPVSRMRPELSECSP